MFWQLEMGYYIGRSTNVWMICVYLRLTVGKLVESFVSLHVQHHTAFGALEASFVPRLQFDGGERINWDFRLIGPTPVLLWYWSGICRYECERSVLKWSTELVKFRDKWINSPQTGKDNNKNDDSHRSGERERGGRERDLDNNSITPSCSSLPSADF